MGNSPTDICGSQPLSSAFQLQLFRLNPMPRPCPLKTISRVKTTCLDLAIAKTKAPNPRVNLADFGLRIFDIMRFVYFPLSSRAPSPCTEQPPVREIWFVPAKTTIDRRTNLPNMKMLSQKDFEDGEQQRRPRWIPQHDQREYPFPLQQSLRRSNINNSNPGLCARPNVAYKFPIFQTIFMRRSTI